MFGPASKSYFNAKRTVGAKHQLGELNEAHILEYAETRKLDEAIVALSLLCILPVDVVERALLASNKEELLILAKALDLSWKTTMALVFLGTREHRVLAKDLSEMEKTFVQLDVATSKKVLKVYHSRKESLDSGFRGLPSFTPSERLKTRIVRRVVPRQCGRLTHIRAGFADLFGG